MSIYSVNILSDCLSVMLQKALLLMDVVILVFIVIPWQIKLQLKFKNKISVKTWDLIQSRLFIYIEIFICQSYSFSAIFTSNFFCFLTWSAQVTTGNVVSSRNLPVMDKFYFDNKVGNYRTWFWTSHLNYIVTMTEDRDEYSTILIIVYLVKNCGKWRGIKIKLANSKLHLKLKEIKVNLNKS